ncbi:MAG: hypothetical protein IKP36_00105 [Bacteroidaceae bacterium]|nr:hypothetical protein [Bacteroidaceae bacterium]
MSEQTIDFNKGFMPKRHHWKFLASSFVFLALFLNSCCNRKPDETKSADAQTEETQRTITAEMAYEGVSNYCHKEYDWSIAEDNPDMMYLQMGEETGTEYQVIFRSYTGAFVYFYVDKTSGTTKMVEKVPNLDVEEDAGTINLFDYLEKKD